MLFTNAPSPRFLSLVVPESGIAQSVNDQWFRWPMVPRGDTYEIQRRETAWPPVESGGCGGCANGGPCASETGIENPDLSPAQRAILKAPGGPKLFAYLREVEDATGMVAEWDPHADIGVCAWCHAPYISDVDECNDVCGSVWAENETIPTGLVSVPGWWNPPADYDPSGTDPVQKQDPELMSGPSIGTPSPGGAGLVGLAALAALFYFGAVKR